jgi:hypothetical protein
MATPTATYNAVLVAASSRFHAVPPTSRLRPVSSPTM